MLELLQVRVTVFAEVFGMSVVPMTSTHLWNWPKNARKRQLTENQNNS